MADLELELAQFSFSSAIRSHYVYLATHLRMRIATVAATVQGRPLLRLARVLCGAYSRAAFMRGAAFIQGNTVPYMCLHSFVRPRKYMNTLLCTVAQDRKLIT